MTPRTSVATLGGSLGDETRGSARGGSLQRESVKTRVRRGALAAMREGQQLQMSDCPLA